MSEAVAANAGRDWDAASYDRISGPQHAWALEVLERLLLAGDETVLDAGCGSGRVTAELLERLPRGRVIGADASSSMVEHARRALGSRAEVFQADLAELTLEEQVDAVFSNAVFHWVPDHARLFGRLFAALRPGGWLVAQCGGVGNVAALTEAIGTVLSRERFHGQDRPPATTWNFATLDGTRARLTAAGFTDVEVWLEPKHVEVGREFMQTVTLGPHLELLSEDLREEFGDGVIEELGQPLTLDYVRLNVDARRPSR